MKIIRAAKNNTNKIEKVFVFKQTGARGPAGTISSLNTLDEKAVVVAADLAITGDSADSFSNKKSTWQQIIDSVLKVNLRSIFGQYDPRTDLIATDTSTMTLNYELGNAFKIDASAMGAGESFTITMSSLPAGAAYSALSLLIVTGANLPTVSYTNLDADVSDPVLVASKDNELIGRTWDNGTKMVWTVGESF